MDKEREQSVFTATDATAGLKPFDDLQLTAFRRIHRKEIEWRGVPQVDEGIEGVTREETTKSEGLSNLCVRSCLQTCKYNSPFRVTNASRQLEIAWKAAKWDQ